jgi:hypothetical protein
MPEEDFTMARKVVATRTPQPAAFPVEQRPAEKGGTTMEYLIVLGVFVLWLILQVWVFPRLGVGT